MKIVQVCPTFFPYHGGVETHVKEISERLVKRGFEVEVLTTDPSGKLQKEDVINGVKVKRFRSFGPNDIYHFSPGMLKELRNSRFDVIHSHDYQDFPMLAAAMSKSCNVSRSIVTLHVGFSKIGKWIYSIYNPVLGRYVFERVERIILVSPATLSSIPMLSRYSEKIRHIPNGVDIPKINSYLKKKGKGSSENGKLRIISVCRLEKKKGLDILIEALRSEGDDMFSLRVIGEGPYARALLERSLGCSSDIEFLGRVDEETLFRAYATSDVFVLPSEYESHSIALTEAMTFGLVPIVSDVGGNHYVVTSGYDGYLLKYPINKSDIVCILQAIKKNPALLHEMGQNARKTAERRFNLNRMVEALVSVYTEARA